MDSDRSGKYDGLTQQQLVALLEKRDRARKLGLVWERDEIEADGHAAEASFVAATPVPELHEGAAPWRNLVIEGDNWDALRWLRMTWTGRVKCILVDPPYNTGNKDWVYNDHFVSADDRWRHSTWLEFLHRRFTLARDLLTEDGVVLVCINDENRAKLELLLDEVLPGMRVGSLVWRTRDTTAATKNGLSDVHEHILVYAGPNFIFAGSAKNRSKYKNPDHDPRGDWNIDPLTLAFNAADRPNLAYPLVNPETGITYPFDKDRVWCFASEKNLRPGQKTRSRTMEENVRQNFIVFPGKDDKVAVWHSIEEVRAAVLDGDVPVTPRDKKPLIRIDDDLAEWVGKPVGFGRPGMKKFWTDLRVHVAPLSSWIARINEDDSADAELLRTGSGGEGTNELQALFGDKAFPYPKPVRLIQQLIAQCANGPDTILDFFAGSATTAQAVIALNAADGGSRRFIMVSSIEATADDPDRNLCRDVTAGRIRRLNASTDPAYAALSAEFAYLRCRTLAFEDLDYDLQPAEAWAALEALHGLPLTPYDPAPWTLHEGDGVALAYVDTYQPDLLPVLRRLSDARTPAFVYAWAPGQVREAASGLEVEVRGVRDTLVARFRQ